MLTVKNLHFSRTSKIVEDVSFSIKKGEIFGIVGASGAGKSTLLKLIAGLLDPESGSVFLGKERVKGPSEKLIPGHSEIQLVNQDFDLDLYHTVRENLINKANYLPKTMCNELVDELLDLLELAKIKNQQAISLSGGEQQRLALGRALCLEPEVVLLDEPFAHLDVHVKRKLKTYLMELNRRRKTTFILVSHDGEEVMTFAQRIAFFADGTIQRITTPEQFYFQPTSEVEALFFGEINRISIGRKTILFRPTEFQICELSTNEGIEVSFQSAHFAGHYFVNQFKYKKNSVVLYHHEPLTYVQKIQIIHRRETYLV